jgi:hypothetical protein
VGIFFRNFQLQPGEWLIGQFPCNWTQPNGARGGRVALTSTSVLFEPNRFDAMVGGRSRRVPLLNISAVSIEPGGNFKSPFHGGIRSRMRLERADGTFELLLINRLTERLPLFQAAVTGSRKN